MIDAPQLAIFVAAATALLVVPGPAVLYIVTRSLHEGRAAGLVSMLGVQAGALVHIAAAVVGLSSLLLASATAFTAVRIAGAAYLIWLGVRTLLGREDATQAGTAAPRRLGRAFRQGVLVNVTNPKTALFFFAFLPQFVDPDRSAAAQIAVLGAVFVAIAVVTDGLYALAAGALGERLRRRRGFLRVQRLVTGTVYAGLGVATAVAGGRER